MSIAYLDINDSNLQLWSGDRRLQSPGYALLEGREYRFGTTARAAARLRPRDVSTRYWWQLSTEPLQPALGPARHSADLVHAHLQALHKEAGQPGELLLAVPGSMHKEQLALLLGIIQQCPFSAVGLVNRSVALASLYRADGPLFHLEVQLHQALLSQLQSAQGEVALQHTVALSGCGLLQLQERLVSTVAAAFVRQTRFDPRRRAETEQQLYDALPAALRQLQRSPEVSIAVQGYHARITRTDLQPASEALCRSVNASMAEQGAGGQLLLDPVTALLPGLQQHLPGILLEADALPGCWPPTSHGWCSVRNRWPSSTACRNWGKTRYRPRPPQRKPRQHRHPPRRHGRRRWRPPIYCGIITPSLCGRTAPISAAAGSWQKKREAGACAATAAGR
ncbi:hypothetical protein [Kineobactrum salinum]|uniref:Uncharacterized protein n=1 Tax=Kineobactrum salinum TaxID=2708301 RepID=A0A6C0U8X8_9GAMM|nr:hypothetical protein [Kineobactrum salinum]QIB66034.1 hypothetical protein G3T16_12015 [Kineobactrum salinum]